jgi:addiction module HigA family antidote
MTEAILIHPGEILREEFLVPMGLTAYRLAKEIQVPVPRINDIVSEKRGISADTALRLGHYFNMSARFWMNLQTHYELRLAAETANLKAIKPRSAA